MRIEAEIGRVTMTALDFGMGLSHEASNHLPIALLAVRREIELPLDADVCTAAWQKQVQLSREAFQEMKVETGHRMQELVAFLAKSPLNAEKALVTQGKKG